MSFDGTSAGCSPAPKGARVAWASAAEVRKYFGLWLAAVLVAHVLDQAAWLSVFFTLLHPGLDGGFGASADLQWVDLGFALARLLAAAAAARMAFRFACREPPARRAEIPDASWVLLVCLQCSAAMGTALHGFSFAIAHSRLGGRARAAVAAILVLGVATALCGEAARRRIERLRALHKSLRSEDKAQRRAHAVSSARRMRFREVQGAPPVSCTICLAGFQDDDTVSELLCGHLYHTECVRVWLAAGPQRVCPKGCSKSKNVIVEKWHSDHSGLSTASTADTAAGQGGNEYDDHCTLAV